ncbi:MAG: oxidoreductase [Candidatus Hydrogenedentota bacterium]
MDLKSNEAPYRSVAPPVDDRGKHLPVSYWHTTIPMDPGPAHVGDTNCDVVILGGGFTGLSIAIELKRMRNDLDIVVLERGVAGHGASGRNGGFAMPLIGWDLTDATKKLGETKAKSAYALMYQAVEHLKQTVKTHAIDCDIEETGYLLLATCKSRIKRVKHEVTLSDKMGFDLQYLEGDSLHQHITGPFLAGAYDPHPCIINPAKLSRGLKLLAESLGVRVYELSPMRSLADGDPIVVRTPQGQVRAKSAVLALNGYSASAGFMSNRIMPVHTYIVLTEPLTQSDLEATGWAEKRTSLETARNFIHYFRLTADNRILFGGEDAELFFDGGLRDTHDGIFSRLKARFREYFPALKHVSFSHQWGGVLGVSMDMFPTFGINGDQQSIFHAGCYSGHGVSLSNYAGVLMAPHILTRLGIPVNADRDVPFFFQRKPMFIPPEPFRYIGLQAYRTILRAMDTIEGA